MAKSDLLCGHKVVTDLGFCEHCVFGKLHHTKFPREIHRTKGTLDYIHSDCWGPSRVESMGGDRYFLLIIDDYSRMSWVFMMKHKSEAFNKFNSGRHWWKVKQEKRSSGCALTMGWNSVHLSLMSSVIVKGMLDIAPSGIHHNRTVSHNV